ncbi:MAG: PTS sugar transporter subunit IIA [Gammaproteobacteria bacterium (ex Lamellibrachia satsuma)]|nr:MAG: PTS IIA-like nitrogen regulatory protein PtsN [Gammaproteobacteria bacterium (ex Lamellibrachia satsuma)]RRS33179.1 MAG: PTS sugar transporter subunit IIA [Gammaproteobacteria bacterium (ex Lamellibrachia satsuma)]RRS36324.1 MAG: PTS sugar transporter subunit IIA [Gammaproteobacteria bacterium (ex Lamellibrachia satsuma)]
MFPDGFIVEERIGCQIEASSKKRVLEELGQRLAGEIPALTQDMVFDSLLQRERLGSTGLGRGIALPHARMPQVRNAIGAFIQLQGGVDFDAVDGQPVDLAFAMLVPEEATEVHLQLLAKLAAMFSDAGFCDKLRKTETAEDIFELIRLRDGASTGQ